MGGAIASPSTAYVYDWNILPIGQQLWLKHLETYIDFPPLQDPASYNLEQVMQQVQAMKIWSRLTRHPAFDTGGGRNGRPSGAPTSDTMREETSDE